MCASLGRITSRGVTGPNNANRYVYAGGDPVNGSDPTGDLFSGGGTLHACAFVCGTIGVDIDSDGPHFVLGAGVGAEIDVQGNIGGAVNKSTGFSSGAECTGSVGPVGIYGESGFGGNGIYGGGGYAPGAELGCSGEVSYEF